MNERPLYFGSRGNLLGILTLPDDSDSARPAVILLNAGLLHRVGPNRLHVQVARRLARSGFPSFRFDMSGVGDSELDGKGLLYIERSVRDVVESMDLLDDMASSAESDTNRYVLMGLCTGAYNAFRAALIDERVSGCVLIDGYSYPTLRSSIRHYAPRAIQVERWSRYLGRKLGLDSSNGSDEAADLVVFENEHVPRDRFADELQSLISRDTNLLMIYTGLGPLAYYYEGQLAAAFPEIDINESVAVRFYPDADHTFMLPGHRERLVGDVEQWLEAVYGQAGELKTE